MSSCSFLDSNGGVIPAGWPASKFLFVPGWRISGRSVRGFLGIVSVDRPIAKINIVEGADGDDVAYDDFIFVQMGGCATPPSGLVSWWPGDGNADDIKDGNSGILMNGAMFAPGFVDQAFTLMAWTITWRSRTMPAWTSALGLLLTRGSRRTTRNRGRTVEHC